MELRWAWAWGPPSLLSPRPAGGETEEEILRVDVLENQIMDFRMSLVMICYNPDFVSVPVLRGLVAVPGPSLAVPWVTSVWGRCCPLGWGDLGAHHPFLLQEKLKPGYLEQLPGKLKLFSNFLGDRKWFAGEKVPWRPRLWGLGRGFVPTLVLTVSPPPAHLRGLPHVRRAGAEPHLRAQVPGALQEPQGLHGVLWGELGHPGEGPRPLGAPRGGGGVP